MAALSESDAAREAMLCITILAHSGHEQQLCIPVAQVSAEPAEVTRQVEAAGQTLVARGETARITYVDEEGDACTLTPGTLSDALTFSEEGTDGNRCLTLLLAGGSQSEPTEPVVEVPPEVAEPVVQENVEQAEAPPLDVEDLASVQVAGIAEQHLLESAPPTDLQEVVEMLQKELAREKEQRELLSEENEALKEREAKFQKGLEAQFARNHVLSERADRLQEECQSLVLEVAELQQKMENDKAEQTARIEEAEEEKQAIQEREEKLRIDLADQLQRNETLSEQVDHLQEHSQNLAAEVDELNKNREDESARLMVATTNLTAVKERYKETALQLQSLQREVKAKEAENKSLKDYNQKLGQRMEEAVQANDTELQSKTEECHNLQALHQAVCVKLGKMRKQLNEVECREMAKLKEQEELTERWSAEVAGCSPLVLDLDADAEPSATGDATERFRELLAATGGNKVFCIGHAHFPSDVGPPAAASTTITLRNVGERPWPSTTALVLAHGDGFGAPLQHVGPAAPGHTVEAVLDLLVPSNQDPGKAHCAWALADAATGARLGPVLVFEASWEEPFV